MCPPIVALALTAAGTAATAAGVRKAQKAQDGAREAERIRQKGFQDEADARATENFNKTNKGATDSGMTKSEEERKAASDAAVSEVRAPVEATGKNLAGDSAAAKLVANENASQAARGIGYALQQGAAKAKLASLNDVWFENSLLNARTNQDIARVANFAKGSADVLPVELEAAARKGQGLRTVGSLLSTAGTAYGLATGAGWFKDAPVPEVGNPVIGNPNAITAPITPEPGKILNLTGVSPSLLKPGSMTTLIDPTGFDWNTLGKRPLFAPNLPSLAPARFTLGPSRLTLNGP